MKLSINKPSQFRTPRTRLLRCLALAFASATLSQLAVAASPLPSHAFANKTMNVGPPDFRMNTAGSTPATTTPATAMTPAQRSNLARVGKNAVGVGLIAIDVLNSHISPTPDVGLIGAGILARNGAKLASVSTAANGVSSSAGVAKAANTIQPLATGVVKRAQRMRELATDAKTPSHIQGWVKQEINAGRNYIRNPPGHDLAHQRGREAAKGFDHRYSQQIPQDLHKFKHSIDNYGRRNTEFPGIKPVR